MPAHEPEDGGGGRPVGIAVTTFWRWMKDERFLAEYRQARKGSLENEL